MANQGINDLIDDIISDLERYNRNIASFAAVEVREELAKTASQAIEAFYHDDVFHGLSGPLFYYRNYYNFRKKSYKKYYKNSHDTKFSGGIILTPENMDELYGAGTKWGADAEFVFETVMQSGWHGLPGEEWHGIRMAQGPKGYKSIYPLDVINEKKQKIERNPSKYINAAIRKAQSLKYRTLFK